MNSHSKATGLSLIRGGDTFSLGVVVRPAAETSLTWEGNGIDVARMTSAAENGTRLTTNSSVARILRHVSLGRVFEWRPTPSATVAGSVPNTLKKENGAAFTRPSWSREVTQAIGRGSTVASMSL